MIFVYVLCLLAVFLVPGYGVARLLFGSRHAFLLSYSFSWTVLLGCLLVSLALDLSRSTTLWMFIVVVMGTIGASVFRTTGTIDDSSAISTRSPGKQAIYLGWFLVVLSASLYHVMAGAYLELPADVYAHLDHLKEELVALESQARRSSIAIGDLFDHGTRHWYRVIAFIQYALGAPTISFVVALSMANTLVMVSAVYFFSLVLFSSVRWNRNWKITVAIVSAFVFVVWFGVNIFSFVRYYALAPVITSYVLYLAIVALLLDVLSRDERHAERGLSYASTMLLFFVSTCLIHLQEAAFSVITLVIVFTTVMLQTLFTQGPRAVFESKSGVICVTITSLAVVVSVLGAILAWERTPIGGIDRGHLMDISRILPFLSGMNILNPRYQFYQFLGLWGCATLFLAVILRRTIPWNPYLLGMTISPLITVFNPLFVETYIRYQSVITLWRFTYVVPIVFIGAYLFVYSIKRSVETRRFPLTVLSIVPAIILVVALLPIDTKFIDNRYSRLPSLLAVLPQNDYRNWADLLVQLDHTRGRQIVTDPVTGYLVSALTRVDAKNHKFYETYSISVSKDSYARDDFDRYHNWTLIVNRRDGGFSQAGELSGHWSPEVLRTSRYYSTEFLKFIGSNPELFSREWERNGIEIYRIL